MRFNYVYKMLLALLLFVACSSNVQAALLDVGPVVEQAINSTEATFGKGDPPLGHGYPRWYRDTNRVPLELCLDRAGGQCATFEPNTAAALNFPNNFSDEAFWWSAAATIDSGNISALLDMAIEAAYSTGDVVPGAQISFARVRIRVSGLPEPGEYTVTTPYKQYHFTVVTDPKDGNEINATEDIGIAEGGVFTGVLSGTVGPFLYCAGAPFSIAGGLYLAPAGGVCPTGSVLGGTYPDASQPAYEFRVQGPGGVNISTGQFSITGKIYTDPIPTPLDIAKSSYARSPEGMQINVFAATQPLSNQVNGLAAFPANFALTGVPSALQVSGTGIDTFAMDTNNPANGSFFKSSGVFAAPDTLPATINVTNTADTPQTIKAVPLVDEVVISKASFSPQSGLLSIAATSLDRVAAPTLEAFMPGMTAPLGTLANGNLNVTFPFTDSSVNPSITYNIPPTTITVKSAIGGAASAAVSTFLSTSTPATGVELTASPAGVQVAGGEVTFTAQATGGDAGPYEYRYLWRSSTGTFTEGHGYGPATWVWDTTNLPTGNYFIQVYVRHIGATGDPDAVNTMSYTLVGSDPLNGICGSSNGQISPSAPTTGLCAIGTPTAVTGTGPWNWTCSGLNGGTASACSALFQTYTVTFVAGANGAISGTTPQTITHGSSTTPVTAVPNAGFFFNTWTDQSNLVVAASQILTVNNVTSDMTLTANFIPSHTVTLARCMSGPTVVSQGSTPGYTFDAAGFNLAATLNGAPITVANSSYTFTNGITANQVFAATYTLNPVGTTAPVRLVKANNSFTEHSTLQAAYNAAVTGDTILLKGGTLAGAFAANRNISITVKGGYEATFTRNCGTTRIGSLSLSLGTVDFEQITL